MSFYELTAESVSEGHPDKIADQISDAILDACIAEDKNVRVACETLITGNKVIIAGEITSSVNIKDRIPEIVRNVVKDIGYTDSSYGFDFKNCDIEILLRPQSPDISIGVKHSDGQLGAGDQGVMFGYATKETPEFMPLPIILAHKLVQKQAELRKNGVLPWLRPDAKSQVTVRYKDNRPVAVENVVFSTQHSPDIKVEEIRSVVINQLIKAVIPENLLSEATRYFVNPTGRFVVGGPAADTGLTGRKNIVDTYGSSCFHGGGSFSGKDPTKVDRSAAYMARYIAKNIVAAELANRCTVQTAYAIGVAEPVSFSIDLYGSGKVSEQKLKTMVKDIFPLTPKGIIESLDLLRPIYRLTTVYGHFGRELPEFTWERTDKIQAIKSCCNLA
jgi:S-adenosylmethionine synthetase